MKVSLPSAFSGACLAAALIGSGCADSEPTLEDVADAREEFEVERQETLETARESEEAVREELEQEREAAEKLHATEEKFEESRARDAFVKDVQQQLDEAGVEIDRLEERASHRNGEAGGVVDTRLDSLHSQHSRAEDALNELKAAELEKWRGHQEKVRTALRDLHSNVNEIR